MNVLKEQRIRTVQVEAPNELEYGIAARLSGVSQK